MGASELLRRSTGFVTERPSRIALHNPHVLLVGTCPQLIQTRVPLSKRHGKVSYAVVLTAARSVRLVEQRHHRILTELPRLVTQVR
jgi:hypothetical protein